MHQINPFNDNLYLKSEFQRECIATSIAISCWIVGILMFKFTNIDYICIPCGLALYAILICILCYYETKWILNKVDSDLISLQNNLNYVNINNKNTSFSLSYVLSIEDGFNAMMRFLGHELCSQNLLCYVELSQYITIWSTKQELSPFSPIIDPNTYLPLIWGFVRLNDEQYNLNIHVDVSLLILCYFKKLYVFIDEFPFFEMPYFEKEIWHFTYIEQKYIMDSACLKINICSELMDEFYIPRRVDDLEYVCNTLNKIRAELWSLLLDSFSKFITTKEYEKLCKNQKILTLSYKDVPYTMYLSQDE
eukprot:234058_1